MIDRAGTPMIKLLATAVIALLVASGSVTADDSQNWKRLNGEQIKQALEGASLVYPKEGGATQDFEPNGSTTYVEGRPSLGEWKVSGAQYCSSWPPAAGWVCYDVSINNERSAVRFIGESGRIYEGEFK